MSDRPHPDPMQCECLDWVHVGYDAAAYWPVGERGGPTGHHPGCPHYKPPPQYPPGGNEYYATLSDKLKELNELMCTVIDREGKAEERLRAEMMDLHNLLLMQYTEVAVLADEIVFFLLAAGRPLEAHAVAELAGGCLESAKRRGVLLKSAANRGWSERESAWRE